MQTELRVPVPLATNADSAYRLAIRVERRFQRGLVFDLLTLLAQHRGRVALRRTILEAIWGSNAVDQPTQLRVLIRSLRKRIERNPASRSGMTARDVPRAAAMIRGRAQGSPAS